jgi:hypothetical protein
MSLARNPRLAACPPVEGQHVFPNDAVAPLADKPPVAPTPHYLTNYPSFFMCSMIRSANAALVAPASAP